MVIPEPERCAALVAVARAVGTDEEVLLVSPLAPGPNEQMADMQPQARSRRRALDRLAGGAVGLRTAVIGAARVWDAVRDLTIKNRTDLLVASWADAEAGAIGAAPEEILRDPPCAVMLVKGELGTAKRVLVPVRGGSYAALAARVGAAVARASGGSVTLLHVTDAGKHFEAGLVHEFAGVALLDRGVDRLVTRFGDPGALIAQELRAHDAVILGATGRDVPDPLGPVGRSLFAAAAVAAVVRTKTPVASSVFLPRPTPPSDRRERSRAIGELVDRWFVANTFASAEFANLRSLVEAKRRQGLRVSVGLPALNEEATIGAIIRSIRTQLMERHPLVDELALIDSRSSDRTREIAASEGIPVYIHDEVLPELGGRVGKGEALWKSLQVLTGDVVVWVDTDVSNFHPKFVYGIVGPLLLRPEISFVKAFYRRPLRIGGELESSGGGRVTELTARPLFNLFFPELSGLVQPLAGEQGGRRELLERLPFFTGYGVETGLLIDTLRLAGLGAIAQVDMKQRVHRNQSLSALSQMSFRIVQVVTKRLGQSIGRQLWEEANATMKLISERPDGGLRLEMKDVEVEERPPMVSVFGYQRR